jgi:hypothetical protein
MHQQLDTFIYGLCEHFTHMAHILDASHSDALIKRMLEHDIICMGSFFGTIDEFGQMAELTLLAECVAYIRMYRSGLEHKKSLDYWTDIALEELHALKFSSNMHKQSVADILEQLKTWQMQQELLELGRISEDAANILSRYYLQVADLFLLRNGIITSRQLAIMRELESTLVCGNQLPNPAA